MQSFRKKQTTHMVTLGKKSWRHSLANTEMSQDQWLNNRKVFYKTDGS